MPDEATMSDSDLGITEIGLASIIPLKTNTVPPYTTTNAVLYGDGHFIVIDPGPSDAMAQAPLFKLIQKRVAYG